MGIGRSLRQLSKLRGLYTREARLRFFFNRRNGGLFGTVLMEEGLEGRKEEASLFLLEDFRVFVFLLPRGGGWLEVELPVFCRDRLKAYTHVSRG